MKRFVVLILSAAMILIAFTGCAPAEPETPLLEDDPAASSQSGGNGTWVFKDSTGREVEVPANITKVAISGPLAQIVIFSLAPEKLVGIAVPWNKGAEEFFDTDLYNLPLLGQLYGSKGELNLESLLASGAEVVIDVGEPKNTIVEDMDDLQEQTGLPFVHITATTETTGDAYRLLGQLLDLEKEAEILAEYCEQTYRRTEEIANSVEKANVLYCLGDKGLNVIAAGSFHAEVIDLIANNLAVVDNPSSKGTGNEVDLEQILNWNPDVILFEKDSIFATAADDPVWQKITAIKEGRYFEVPDNPYNWMGFPPSVQRSLGMIWMAQLLYPETAGYDLAAEVRQYYRLFYHCDLSAAQYDQLVLNSLAH